MRVFLLAAGAAAAAEAGLRGSGPPAGAYKMIRFTPTALRNVPDPPMVQMAEIEFRKRCSTSDKIDIKSTNPEANSAASSGNEAASMAVDGDYNTKWLDNAYPSTALTVTFNGAVPEIDAFRIVTGNDEPDRDPISWKLEGNSGMMGAQWIILNQAENYNTPTDRMAPTGWLAFSGACSPGGGPSGKGAGADDLDVSGCTAGCAFLIIFFVGGFTYFAAGIAINYKKYEMRGVETVPHLTFWKDLPLLVKDGVQFSIHKARGGYAAV